MKVNFDRTSAGSVFDAIKRYGHDEDFEGKASDCFEPTVAPPGSSEKIEVLAQRVEKGLPLYHQDDCQHDSGPQPWTVPSVDDDVIRRTRQKSSDD